jgi:hypothetical protein
MYMRGMHMRAIVNECPASNGGINRLVEHGSVEDGRCGRRQVMKQRFSTMPNAVTPPVAFRGRVTWKAISLSYRM